MVVDDDEQILEFIAQALSKESLMRPFAVATHNQGCSMTTILQETKPAPVRPVAGGALAALEILGGGILFLLIGSAAWRPTPTALYRRIGASVAVSGAGAIVICLVIGVDIGLALVVGVVTAVLFAIIAACLLRILLTIEDDPWA
jgi:hypothetical protein